MKNVKKFFVASLLLVVTLPFVACAPAGMTPRGPSSEKSDKPWNDQLGPEGAGPLGMLIDR